MPSPESGESQRDYVGIATAYAREAVADRKGKRFGKWVRLAARRFLSDMKRAARTRAPWRFDAWHACDPCRFIEQLPHVEGTWDSATIVLHPAHVFATVNIFGFRNRDGTRRFTTALFAIARKNAKSTWAAGVALYCELCEGELGPQVIAAATTGSQARVVFDIAKKMVQRTPDLRTAFGVEAFANAIACLPNGGTFKPINAKASTQDGLNPSAVVLDEVHAHKSPDLLNVLKSAAGARSNPLFLFTTTEGFETPGPWPEQRKFAQQVLDGAVEAYHYFAIIFALDDEDDDFDASAWPKANPLMAVNEKLAREIAKEAIEAKRIPSQLAEFRIKRLNRQSSTSKGWINLPKWKRCGGAVDLEALRTVPCWGGLDLASTSDLCSLRLVWRLDGCWLTWGRRWVPADQVKQRTERGTVNYSGWVTAGLITETEGDVTDYEVIRREVVEVRDRFNVQLLAYDDWNATQLVNELIEDGLPMVRFIQGGKSYHPAMQELERAYVSRRLAHGVDPVLQWQASNIVVRYDENQNMAPSKKRSADKIDDMCALLMGMGAALTMPAPTTSVYDRRELRMV